MEKTEGKTAIMLADSKCNTAYIESNNGGRGFARNVEKIMRETINYSGCQVKWFHQGQNKQARILSNCTSVTNSIIMPENWKAKYKEFYDHVSKAGRSTKLIHDDFADMLTGIVEKSLIANRANVPDKNVRGALGI
jgi:predicted phage terminase large subunit-like protein